MVSQRRDRNSFLSGSKDLGWTQEKIAKAYDVSQQMVSQRINLHELPDEVKKLTTQNLITETQLREILPLQLELYFSPWLTTDQVRLLCARDVVSRMPSGFNQNAFIFIPSVLFGHFLYCGYSITPEIVAIATNL